MDADAAPRRARRYPKQLPSHEQALAACKYLAMFLSPHQVVRRLYDEEGMYLKPDQVEWVSQQPQYQSVIATENAAYVAAIMHVPIAHRRVRLERLEAQYQALLDEEGQVPPQHRREARQVLEQARRETEGPSTQTVTNILNLHLERLSDQELAHKRLVLLKTLETLEAPDHAERLAETTAVHAG